MIDYFSKKKILPSKDVREVIHTIKKNDGNITYNTSHTVTNAIVKVILRDGNSVMVRWTTYDEILKNNLYYNKVLRVAFEDESVLNDIMNNFDYHDFYENLLSEKEMVFNYTSVLNSLINGDIKSSLVIHPNIEYISGLKSKSFFLTEKKKYSFGIEIESSGGFAPSYLWSNKYDVCAIRDGSIAGKEYITCPLTGDDGLMALQYICNEISKHCTVDATCGLHCHINSSNLNKEEIVFLFILLERLEADIFSTLPMSRRKNNMCRKIRNIIKLDINGNETLDEYKMKISRCYDNIFKLYHSESKTDKNHNKSKMHEKGPKVGYDRTKMRYAWVNFVPTLMKCRDYDKYGYGIHTVEFRCHEGTFNFENIKNWILVLMGIIHYSENNKKRIINNEYIGIEDIIKYSYPNTHKYLIQYIQERKSGLTNVDAGFIENKQFTLKELINKHKSCA